MDLPKKAFLQTRILPEEQTFPLPDRAAIGPPLPLTSVWPGLPLRLSVACKNKLAHERGKLGMLISYTVRTSEGKTKKRRTE